MDFNPKDYLDQLDNLDLDEVEKIELIESLWRVAQCFVDAAFDDGADEFAERFSRAANDNEPTGEKKGAA